ncbi:hypothetical protein RCG23_14050 [Neobacillus sp. PS3-34]|uniref:hypothetical protein n=1 Tax=Neobacillus sp. PS3-34 TaxID=3070678 RepID=UPI0027DF3CFC|nr:hypothetical protein [Neobacillus sp. PS3-34]WML46763.1 hypothetical protein RCG23_14050 [Neobacillus sp. PS3-34]
MGILLVLSIVLSMWILRRYLRTKGPFTLNGYRERETKLFVQKGWKELINLSKEKMEKFQLDESERAITNLTIGHSYFMLNLYESGYRYYQEGINILNVAELPFIRTDTFQELMDFLIKERQILIAKKLYIEVKDLKLHKKDLDTLKKYEYLISV